mgnify:CR=1 FL=1
MTSGRFLGRIRDADWLDAERALAYPRVIGAVTLLTLLGMALTANGVVDSRGEPLGADFSNFWSASRLALMGEPAAVYDMARQYAVQRQEFGAQTGFYPFFYPPTYLLICWPLAALPYLSALAVWVAVTGYAYAAVVRRFGDGALGLAPILAFPAVFVTIGHGQNALLTTAILGAAALSLDKRPLVAGAHLEERVVAAGRDRVVGDEANLEPVRELGLDHRVSELREGRRQLDRRGLHTASGGGHQFLGGSCWLKKSSTGRKTSAGARSPMTRSM